MPTGLAVWLILSGLLLRAADPVLQLLTASSSLRASLLAGGWELSALLMLGAFMVPALLPFALASIWVLRARSVLDRPPPVPKGGRAVGTGQRLLGLAVWAALLTHALGVLALPLWSLPALLALPAGDEVAISPASAASYGWRGYLLAQGLLLLVALLLTV
ncbi:MAG: hypothetical protein KDH20_02055, partial [Rhodocyclaceae bacterium]|nr:hypothetical protein [Rhodocyclaceae bacterium]